MANKPCECSFFTGRKPVKTLFLKPNYTSTSIDVDENNLTGSDILQVF